MITGDPAAPPLTVRAAEPAELPLLRALEVAAGEPFRALGMAEIADDDPLPLARLARHLAGGHAWVVAGVGPGPAAGPLACLVAEPLDADLHIAQVSVPPGAARRGLGAALVEHAGRVAALERRPALTLTTFRDVPWNAPYYRRLGFAELAGAELGPGLRAVRAGERAAGLDRWPRLAMRRPVTPERR